mmetsp:Transcript_31341/g.45766  ORF Transcript_31341/g.45766 Transcript_31341/m.45766 type:complete len:437 (-) Transcript_31341:1751-3061(-)
MSRASATDIVISANTDENQLYDYLLGKCSGTTPAILMKSVEKLPNSDNTRMIGTLGIGASMTSKTVINRLRSKTSVTLDESWLINQDINFTMFAMLGHVIFMLPEADLTTKGAIAKKAYQKTIGGVLDITHFNDTSSLEGRKERATILLKWSSRLKGFDVMKHKSLLAKKFPHLVRLVRGSPFGLDSIFKTAYALVTFVLLYLLFRFILSLVFPVIKLSVLLTVLYFLSLVIMEYALPMTASHIADSIGVSGPSPSAVFGLEAVKDAGLAVLAFASRLMYAIAAYGIQLSQSLISAAYLSVRAAPKVFQAASNAVNTQGRSISEYFASAYDVVGDDATIIDKYPDDSDDSVYEPSDDEDDSDIEYDDDISDEVQGAAADSDEEVQGANDEVQEADMENSGADEEIQGAHDNRSVDDNNQGVQEEVVMEDQERRRKL